MKTATNIWVQKHDTPGQHISEGDRALPILELDGAYGRTAVWLSDLTPQQAIEYLMALADAAHALADGIVARHYEESGESLGRAS